MSYNELPEKECPYCGEPVKVYPNHLPCEGVENVEAGE